MSTPDHHDADRLQGYHPATEAAGYPTATGSQAGPGFPAAAPGYPSGPIEYPASHYAPPPYVQPPYVQPPYAQAGAVPGYPYAPPGAAPRNGLGTAAMVLGIIAVVLCWTVYFGVLLGILAICFGSVGLARAKRGEATNKGSATAGLVLGIVAVALLLVLLLVGLSMYTMAS